VQTFLVTLRTPGMRRVTVADTRAEALTASLDVTV
jgi:hypothetical protein